MNQVDSNFFCIKIMNEIYFLFIEIFCKKNKKIYEASKRTYGYFGKNVTYLVYLKWAWQRRPDGLSWQLSKRWKQTWHVHRISLLPQSTNQSFLLNYPHKHPCLTKITIQQRDPMYYFRIWYSRESMEDLSEKFNPQLEKSWSFHKSIHIYSQEN